MDTLFAIVVTALGVSFTIWKLHISRLKEVKELEYIPSEPAIPGKIEPGEEIIPETPVSTPKPVEKPAEAPIEQPKITIMTKREQLYNFAKGSLGKDMSPNDVAPDTLACMESVDGTFFGCFGEHLLKSADRLSTQRGYRSMLKDPRLVEIPHNEIQEGDISIAPTGYSTKNSPHGHVGIWGKTTVMSNNSDTGLWSAHYTHEAWENVFHKTLGFPLRAFRVIG